MTAFGRELLGNIYEASRREWLVTNGIGGFASSSLPGLNTRRYHGVLVAARRPPTERLNLVSRVEETLVVDGTEYPLSTTRYAKVLYPSGYLHLERFEIEPFPTWYFQVGDVLVSKSLFMIYGQNTTVITYRVLAGQREVELRIRPHFLFRDFHGNMYENPGFIDNSEISDGGLTLQPFGNAPVVHMAWDHGSFVRDGYWFRDIFLQEEERRGLTALEDDYSNGYLRVPHLNTNVSLVFSDEPITGLNPMEARKREEQRRQTVAGAMSSDDPFLHRLLLAADQFIVDRHSTGGKSILAGYPWFNDWGRDSLIALPGLTLVSGRFDDARSILLTFARSVRDGLVPNCFADRGVDAMYNSVDASLWYFFAVYKLIEYTDDYPFVEEHLFPAMCRMIEAFQNGTRYSIRMDPDDGLISAGEPGVQLTWMDAKVNDWVVTPREGKAVEINALWYNALKIHELLLEKFENLHEAREIGLLARKVRSSFRRTFWNEDHWRLFDVIRLDGTPDPANRPNQIFATYLPFPLLEHPQEVAVVENVFRTLYTSLGLRSLDPADPAYQGRFEGDRLHRDGAYHQGTVWSYLIGPFITSYLKDHQGSMEAHLRASCMLEVFKAHLARESCIGSISEVFDGDAPHRSGGCVAQAWSVAELLRCYVEDLKRQKPVLVV